MHLMSVLRVCRNFMHPSGFATFVKVYCICWDWVFIGVSTLFKVGNYAEVDVF